MKHCNSLNISWLLVALFQPCTINRQINNVLIMFGAYCSQPLPPTKQMEKAEVNYSPTLKSKNAISFKALIPFLRCRRKRGRWNELIQNVIQ